MNAFILELDNRPGAVADVAEAIAERGINLTGGAGVTCGNSGSLVITANDESGVRSALTAAGFTYREVELVPATIADKPGALADVCRKLANAGVNLEAMLPVGMSDTGIRVAFGTSDAARARSILGSSSTVNAGR